MQDRQYGPNDVTLYDECFPDTTDPATLAALNLIAGFEGCTYNSAQGVTGGGFCYCNAESGYFEYFTDGNAESNACADSSDCPCIEAAY